MRISATNGLASGSVEWALPPEMNQNGTWVWSLPRAQQNVPIMAGGKLLASVKTADLRYDEDPGVTLNFSIQNNSPDPVQITVSSVVVNFPTMVNPLAFATAAMTVTDGDSNGATMTGLFPGNKAYEASYNAGPLTWAQLVSPVTANPDDSNTGKERLPAAGRQTIPGNVSSIEAVFKFSLTANDSASGTGRFDVIPEPATITLLLVGVALSWRRRR